MTHNNNVDTPAEWGFLIFFIGICILFIIAIVIASWRDFQYEQKELEEREARKFKQHIIDMEHEIFTGPFASHPTNCPLCKSEMKEGA